jgi:hypothetical protein
LDFDAAATHFRTRKWVLGWVEDGFAVAFDGFWFSYDLCVLLGLGGLSGQKYIFAPDWADATTLLPV